MYNTYNIAQKFSVLSIQIIILYFHELPCDGEAEIVRLRYKNYRFTRYNRKSEMKNLSDE